MKLQIGQSLISRTDTTTILVLKAGGDDVALVCGGAEMSPLSEARSGETLEMTGQNSGSLIGKRYVNADESIELLCTRGGPASLVVDGEPLSVKSAKPLPASD